MTLDILLMYGIEFVINYAIAKSTWSRVVYYLFSIVLFYCTKIIGALNIINTSKSHFRFRKRKKRGFITSSTYIYIISNKLNLHLKLNYSLAYTKNHGIYINSRSPYSKTILCSCYIITLFLYIIVAYNKKIRYYLLIQCFW